MLHINKVIKLLIGADLTLAAATGLINPIFAIFIVGSISGGSVKLAGTAIAIYWFTISVGRIPIAYFLDKKSGELDDYYSLICGFFIYSFCQFLYLFARNATHIYAIQILLGLGGAIAFSPWYGFFSRHIDKHHENFEWSIEVAIYGLATSAASFASGLIASRFGFPPLFIASGLFTLLGAVSLLFLKSNLKHPNSKSI